ncbi:MAG: helix-turn-helix domain-containing protein [Leadbetterella sp.]
MNFYKTPLQFGYFLGLLFGLVFIFRGIKERNLSDRLLGFVLCLLSMQLQDYTFGFSGINILWSELQGFPRHFPWLLPTCIYLYFLAKTNVNFKLEKKHLVHFVPYIIYFLVRFFIFFIPMKAQIYKSDVWRIWNIVEDISYWFAIFWFTVKCLKLYKGFNIYTQESFSNVDEINLKWLQHFLFAFIIGSSLHLSFSILDLILDLPFEKDFYWQYFTILMIIYFGINGLTQTVNTRTLFKPELEKEKVDNPQVLMLKAELTRIMEETKVYLDPELNLNQLAKMLKTNSSVLSAAINQNFNLNFNDFVNKYRIQEYKVQLEKPENKLYTKLSIAFDCGFNSKSTFNRAFNKWGNLSE